MQKKEIAPIIPPKDMILGSPEASVLLTVYGDYESIETRKLNEIVMELLTTFNGKLKFSFRHFPLTQLHQRAHKAAEAVIAAGQEGKYWEMHQLVLENPKALGIISLKSLARDAGAMNKHFLEQLMNGVYGWNVQEDLREGISLGIKDIPTLLLNGKLIDKPYTLPRITKLIQDQLKGPKKGASSNQLKAA